MIERDIVAIGIGIVLIVWGAFIVADTLPPVPTCPARAARRRCYRIALRRWAARHWASGRAQDSVAFRNLQARATSWSGHQVRRP